MDSHFSQLTPGWHVYGRNHNLQNPFDAAVVMPTVGRDSILEAVHSVYAQEDVGRIQLLIGVDSPLGDFTRLQELLETTPDHVTPCFFYPGYSTSARHGGLHPSRDGGALRTVLSYMANARYIAYLDDDNWWAPNHLSSMLSAVLHKDWAFSLRWFVHPESRQPVCIDDWESVGPGRGGFAQKFGGWVDPNCLIIDKLACEPTLRWWGIPLPGDKNAMSADRHVYDWLQKKGPPGETGQASVYYAIHPKDSNHPIRLQHMGSRYAAASYPVRAGVARLTAITICKNRLHHLKQTLPLLANQPLVEVIVVDYGCPQGAAAWVRENHPQVKVIEVMDDPGLNIARARNIGAKAASTPWLLFIDADVVVKNDLSEWIRGGLKPEGFYMTRADGTDLSGTSFCTRHIFDSVGGYDEAIRGWGGEDDDLYFRLFQAGQQRRHYPDAMFTTIPHDDEERFRFRPGSNKDQQMMLNHWYRNMKYDLMAIRGRDLSLAERASLYKLAADAEQQAFGDASLTPVETFLSLVERTQLPRNLGWKLERRLVYKLAGRTTDISGKTPGGGACPF